MKFQNAIEIMNLRKTRVQLDHLITQWKGDETRTKFLDKVLSDIEFAIEDLKSGDPLVATAEITLDVIRDEANRQALAHESARWVEDTASMEKAFSIGLTCNLAWHEFDDFME